MDDVRNYSGGELSKTDGGLNQQTLPFQLMIAVLTRDMHKLEKLIEMSNVDLETHIFYGGYTILHIAAVEGALDVLRLLVEKEGFSASPETSLKRTPLHLAAQYGQSEIVRYLVIDQSADPSYPDQNGLNALHHACIGGSLKVVKFLVAEMSMCH